ncbi:MAG: glycerophosphodiester phosphodiesterase [Planctomycetota bacterium]|nr:MAG: glycerophosphodiester phosphodiesterase [Planctomycetota bacterium]
MKVIAHRGAAAEAPENTLEAVARAIELGADLVEVDVRSTSDGIPVLIHDADLVRTHSVAKLVGDLELSELEKITAEHGTAVPTLSMLFARYGGKVDFILEIKDALATESVVRQIVSDGYIENVLVACASLRVLRNVKFEIPEIKTGFVLGSSADEGFESSKSRHNGYGFSVSERVLPVIDVMMPYWRLVRHHFVAGCRRYALPVYAWLALFDEDPGPRYDIFSQMAEVGIDGLATIRPEALRAHLAAPSAAH